MTLYGVSRGGDVIFGFSGGCGWPARLRLACLTATETETNTAAGDAGCSEV
jgi:hypothetical protein